MTEPRHARVNAQTPKRQSRGMVCHSLALQLRSLVAPPGSSQASQLVSAQGAPLNNRSRNGGHVDWTVGTGSWRGDAAQCSPNAAARDGPLMAGQSHWRNESGVSSSVHLRRSGLGIGRTSSRSRSRVLQRGHVDNPQGNPAPPALEAGGGPNLPPTPHHDRTLLRSWRGARESSENNSVEVAGGQTT